MMNCPICNGEMRIATEQIGVDNNNLPVFHRFAYCDVCRRKKDIDLSPNTNNTNDTTDKTNQEAITTEQIKTNSNLIVDNKKEQEIKRAEYELKHLTGIQTSIFYILALASLLFSIIFAFAKMRLIAFGLFVAFILLLIFYFQRENRQKQLIMIIRGKGKNEIKVCPKCKSINIEMQAMQIGSSTMYEKGIITNHVYSYSGNYNAGRYLCKDCGNIFKYAEKIYK